MTPLTFLIPQDIEHGRINSWAQLEDIRITYLLFFYNYFNAYYVMSEHCAFHSEQQTVFQPFPSTLIQYPVKTDNMPKSMNK